MSDAIQCVCVQNDYIGLDNLHFFLFSQVPLCSVVSLLVCLLLHYDNRPAYTYFAVCDLSRNVA